MADIQTVTGSIDVEALGHCQMHEHLMVRPGPATEANPALLIDDEVLSCRELYDYARWGGNAVVDCQPGGAGRDAAALARISQGSGTSVIATTGFHLPMFYPEGHWVFTEPQPALYQRFLRELQEGMDDGQGRLPMRAGAVKAAIGDDGPAGRAGELLAAAAMAAAAAQVPLLLHTEYGRGALDALDICQKQGLPPEKVLVCHVDRQAENLAPHEEIAKAGAMLEYDTIARYKYHDDDAERALILHMLSLGYANRLLLSLDTTRQRLARYGGQPGLSYILQTFLPSLQKAGMTEADIHTLTVLNPARAFTWQA